VTIEDKDKDKDKSKDNGNGPSPSTSLRVRMTAQDKQQRRSCCARYPTLYDEAVKDGDPDRALRVWLVIGGGFGGDFEGGGEEDQGAAMRVMMPMRQKQP